MTEAFPGETCPETGIWVPSDNPNFYPTSYFNKDMRRSFNAGETMPTTPHNEPSWILEKQGKLIEDFSGLSPKEITEKAKSVGIGPKGSE